VPVSICARSCAQRESVVSLSSGRGSVRKVPRRARFFLAFLIVRITIAPFNVPARLSFQAGECVIARWRRQLAGEIELSFWKNKEHEEVDFVVRERGQTSKLIQVCWDLSKTPLSHDLRAHAFVVNPSGPPSRATRGYRASLGGKHFCASVVFDDCGYLRGGGHNRPAGTPDATAANLRNIQWTTLNSQDPTELKVEYCALHMGHFSPFPAGHESQQGEAFRLAQPSGLQTHSSCPATIFL
jgi:hypothetical protein